MLKKSFFCFHEFPSRHQYTWPRVEVQCHPLEPVWKNSEIDTMYSASDSFSVAEGLSNSIYYEKNIEISKKIAAISKFYFKECVADGEWKWLNENRRVSYLSALKTADVDNLVSILSNLFRYDASYGIVSGTYSDFCDPLRRKNIINGILCDVDTWLDYTNLVPEQYLDMPNIGMPYGVKFGEQLISPDICRHDYHAEVIFQLTEGLDSSTATVLEIGGGYGGAAYQFFKRRKSNKKCQWIIVDLFETLCVQYYWLTSCGIKVNFSFDCDCKYNYCQVILVPSDLAGKIGDRVDIVYNCNSFSEMARTTVEHYFNLINSKWKPEYIFHQNSDVLLYPDSPRHVEILSSEFPIGNAYKKVYRTLSPWAGGNGRYREYLYNRKLSI